MWGMLHALTNILADHTGAAAAGTASTLATVAYATGQLPIPAGIPPELVWLSVTFGFPLVWGMVTAVKVGATYAVTRRKQADRRSRLLIDSGRSIDDDEVERHLDTADKWGALASALGRADSEITCKRKAS